MKGEFCLYSDKMLFCQEQYCVNCAVYDRWLLKTDKLLGELGYEEIKKECVQNIPRISDIR